MKILYENSKIKQSGGMAPWLRRLILAWLAAVTVECLFTPLDLSDLQGLAQISVVRIAAVAAVIFAALWVLSRMGRTAWTERWAMAGVFAALAVCSLISSFTWPFLVACVLVLAVLVVYALHGWDRSKMSSACAAGESRKFVLLTAAAALAFFLLVSVWTVCRVYSFSTPTYDFGIFAQMFHSMRTTLLPITTVERDGALSHFAVHVSPIYYLLLPF